MRARIELEVETHEHTGDFAALEVDGQRFMLPADKPASRQLGKALASAAARAAERERDGR